MVGDEGGGGGLLVFCPAPQLLTMLANSGRADEAERLAAASSITLHRSGKLLANKTTL